MFSRTPAGWQYCGLRKMTVLEAIARKGILPDEWFEREDGTPMTKGFTRSVIMSLLNPLDGASVLEIGSGTGAVTVELARSVGGGGRVTSVEILHAAASLARRNVERSGLSGHARLIEGRAPDDIPEAKYDAVFIGGHGGELESIMRSCFGMMKTDGRMILTSVSPGTTSVALSVMEEMTPSVGFWRAQASAGRRIRSDWLLVGNNPVDVIWGDK